MKLTCSILVLVFSVSIAEVAAQKRRTTSLGNRSAATVKPREIGSMAVVMDETLAVLRIRPSLFADSVQRMHRGRRVRILGSAEADGVKFYKVAAPPNNSGWVQSDAVFGAFRESDEQRLAILVQAADGFNQIELAAAFFEMYPVSKFRPAMLLLYGDLIEETALKISRDANSRLSRREMAASGAPVHSYYLNFVSLDRYRKLGVRFLFNPATRTFHYDGNAWNEIVTKFAAAPESAEARKRLDSLKEKLAKKAN
ncbi:MAG: hypothetical protein ABR535_06230 [Pyrinomonadaceae bacterium]